MPVLYPTRRLADPQAHGHGKIPGGGMVGTHAGDMIGEVALAIEKGADAVDIGKTIHPHPTLGERSPRGSGLNTVRLDGIAIQMGVIVLPSYGWGDDWIWFKGLLSQCLPAKACIGRVSTLDHTR